MQQTELIVMVGESGSGKSTLAHQMVEDKGGQEFKRIRLNRDELRLMAHGGNIRKREMETLVTNIQRSAARMAIVQGFSPVIDDTNLNPKTRLYWKDLAFDEHVPYREVRMDTSLAECVARDAKRAGSARVGAAVIHRQFLESGRLPIDLSKPIVIVDVDGTVAYNNGHRSFYDESRVLDDDSHPVVVQWVQELAKDHIIIIVSGRHSTCGDHTAEWLRLYNVPYEFLFMRHAWDDRDDCIVKKEILDAILKLVPKEQIKMVLDDRPKVVRMWREAGLKVIPVAGACEEF